jgi:hypothetical protein
MSILLYVGELNFWSIGPVSYSPKFSSEDNNKSVLKNKESTFHKTLYKQVV